MSQSPQECIREDAMQDIRNNMGLINDLIHAVEALQRAGMSVTLEQLEDGRFSVGAEFGEGSVEVIAEHPVANLEESAA